MKTVKKIQDINEYKAEKEKTKIMMPDLSLNDETMDFMAKMLIHDNFEDKKGDKEHSLKISNMLSSGHGGFLDKAKYPNI